MNQKAMQFNFQDHFRQIDVRLAKDKNDIEGLVTQIKKKLQVEHARIVESDKNIEAIETKLNYQTKQREE